MDDERLTVQLDFPHDLLDVLNVGEHELGPKLKLLIALELFREETISSGKAAEVAGLSKCEFIDETDAAFPTLPRRPRRLRRRWKRCGR